MPTSYERREQIDARLDLGPEFEPCTACGHRMIRSRGRCWSACGCTEGKHKRQEQFLQHDCEARDA